MKTIYLITEWPIELWNVSCIFESVLALRSSLEESGSQKFLICHRYCTSTCTPKSLTKIVCRNVYQNLRLYFEHLRRTASGFQAISQRKVSEIHCYIKWLVQFNYGLLGLSLHENWTTTSILCPCPLWRLELDGEDKDYFRLTAMLSFVCKGLVSLRLSPLCSVIHWAKVNNEEFRRGRWVMLTLWWQTLI